MNSIDYSTRCWSTYDILSIFRGSTSSLELVGRVPIGLVTRRCHICFAHKATEVVRRRNMSRRATTGLMHRSKEALFNHFVGASEQRGRDLQPELPCSFLVHDQLKFGWRLNRQFRSIGTAQDSINIGCSPPKSSRSSPRMRCDRQPRRSHGRGRSRAAHTEQPAQQSERAGSK